MWDWLWLSRQTIPAIHSAVPHQELRTPPPAILCNEGAETVPRELGAFGKAGEKIEQAREGVLDILRSENACRAWFEAKETASAATFQSLHYFINQRAPYEIMESQQGEFLAIYRQPYVAQATQDGGPNTTITINAYGAFFRSMGNVLRTAEEGGPLRRSGTHLLTVGSYSGNTRAAQMLTLLHEFGHIIGPLPEDADNLDGESVRNTNEVLSHCRPEIEARSQIGKQTVKR